MRRWNGWGDDSIIYPVPASAVKKLETWAGPSSPKPEAKQEDVLKSIPASRLPKHPLVHTDALTRLTHAVGQSFADWVAMRSGNIPTFPDGVAFPENENHVADLITYARETGVKLIPYGGGTSVVGHLTACADQPTLTINMGRMNQLLSVDKTSMLATFGAGVAGPDLEAHLRAHGLTLGHYPQSFEYSTLGGWIVTRSSGQQSLRYGRIEKLFAGGRVVSPAGVLDLPTFPASAAGPDLRESVLGSEGRFGFVTQATVRVSPLPQMEAFHAVFFPDFEHGQEAVRQILQNNLPMAMLRLSTARETATTLALAGHETAIGALESLLSLRKLKDEKTMLLLGFVGNSDLMRTTRHAALGICERNGGVHVGRVFGEQWHKNRFKTPYMRNTLWEMGYAIDTLETATTWAKVPETLAAIETAIREGLTDEGERVHVFTHLSHTYASGCSIYVMYLFRMADIHEATLARWKKLKNAASQAIVANGATISHQHGVGLDHAPYLTAEKGELGMTALRGLAKTFDPDGVMNPGKLLV
jgi:alkyldihydroxyacetonephosphate synthase